MDRVPITGIKITADKKVSTVTLRGLSDYQREVGGWIEAVDLNDTGTIYINEEGKLEGLPFNSIATDLASYRGGLMQVGPYADVLVGDAIVVGPIDGDGYDTDIPEHLVRDVIKITGEAGGRFLNPLTTTKGN